MLLHQLLGGEALAANVAPLAHAGAVYAAVFAQLVLRVVLHAALGTLKEAKVKEIKFSTDFRKKKFRKSGKN